MSTLKRFIHLIYLVPNSHLTAQATALHIGGTRSSQPAVSSTFHTLCKPWKVKSAKTKFQGLSEVENEQLFQEVIGFCTFVFWTKKVLLMTQHKSWFSLNLGLFLTSPWYDADFSPVEAKSGKKQMRTRNNLSPTYQNPLLVDLSGFCHLIHFTSLCTWTW